MIKKNLFLLFCFYLFVVQSAICWFLRHDCNFFRLACINFLVFIVIAIFSKEENENVDSKGTTHKINANKEFEVKEEKTVVKRVSQWKKYPISNIRFFIIAVLVWIFLRLWLSDTIMHLRLIISIAWSFVIYLLLWAIFWSKIAKTKITLLYVVLLILSWIRSIINFFDLVWNIDQIFSNQNTWEVLEIVNEEDVLWTGIIDNSVEELSWDNLTWELYSGDVLSWEYLSWGSENIETFEENTWNTLDLWDPNQLATFREVLKFLFTNTTLDTNTNVSFKNVSKLDENYAYFRTAYDKKMIWTDIIPTQKPTCETFVVMKWLNEWWNVWSYSNIKDAYWKYASANWKLPGCKYWSYIKIWEMK